MTVTILAFIVGNTYMRWAQNSKLFKPIANNMLFLFKNRDLLKTLRPILLKVDRKNKLLENNLFK